MPLRNVPVRLTTEFVRRVPVYPKTKRVAEINKGKLLDASQLISLVYRLSWYGRLCEDYDHGFCFASVEDKKIVLEMARSNRLYYEEGMRRRRGL